MYTVREDDGTIVVRAMPWEWNEVANDLNFPADMGSGHLNEASDALVAELKLHGIEGI